ncbi:hypothetical protein BVY03_03070 [bacterium K02(2017)]|nr:hypothetical protein BVY03_03070 [bacterium K02(2017)]
MTIKLFNMLSSHTLYRHLAIFVLLALLITLNLFQSFSYPLNFDSLAVITEKSLLSFWENLSFHSLIFSHRYVVHFISALQTQVFGFELYWFRVINAFFHILNSYCLFVFLFSIFKSTLDPMKYSEIKITKWALVGALLFAVSAVSVFATAYVVQRFIVIATFFGLLTSIFYVNALQALKNKKDTFWAWVLLSVFCYFLAVHSKEHVVMIPVMLCLITYMFGLIKLENIKYLLLPALLYFIVALQITLLSKGLLFKVYEPHATLVIENLNQYLALQPQSTINLDHDFIYLLSLINQCWLFFNYLYLWVVPDVWQMALEINLKFPTHIFSLTNIMGLVLFFSYLALGVKLISKKDVKRLLGFGMLFPMALFLTEFSTVRFNESFVLYRSYLWIGGFYAILPWFLNLQILKRLPLVHKVSILSIYLLVMILAHQNRLMPFSSDLKLWTDISSRIDFNDKSIPSSFRAAGNLGSALGKDGQFDEAIKYYKIASELNPGYILPWRTLGAVIAIDGNPQQSIRFLLKAIEINPKHYEPYYNLGSVYSKLENYELAAKYLKTSTDLNPTFSEALYNYANVLFKLGNFKEAVDFYKKTIAANAAFIDAYHNLAVCFTELGLHEEAIKYYKTAIKFNPKHDRAYYNMGRSNLHLKQYSQAFDYFKKSQNLNSKFVFAYHYAGVALLQSGKIKQAMLEFKNALKLNGQFEPTLNILKAIQQQSIQ